MAKVSLRDLSEKFMMQGDGMEIFLNLATGETFFVTPDISDHVADEDCDLNKLAGWEREEVARIRAIFKTKKYLSLPSKHDINEWDIMEGFCDSLTDPTQKTILQEAINSKGAFHRFRSQIEKMGLLQDWYDHKEDQLIEMARIWCEKHNIPYLPVEKKLNTNLKKKEITATVERTEGQKIVLEHSQEVYMLRPAKEDRDAWSEFRSRLYVETNMEDLEAELDDLMITDRVAGFLVWTEDGEQAVGFVELSKRNVVDGCATSPVAYIEGIYMLEAFRGKGLGQQLIDFCKKWTALHNMTELATDASLHDVTAQKFHLRMGFQQTERIVQFKMKV